MKKFTSRFQLFGLAYRLLILGFITVGLNFIFGGSWRVVLPVLFVLLYWQPFARVIRGQKVERFGNDFEDIYFFARPLGGIIVFSLLGWVGLLARHFTPDLEPQAMRVGIWTIGLGALLAAVGLGIAEWRKKKRPRWRLF